MRNTDLRETRESRVLAAVLRKLGEVIRPPWRYGWSWDAGDADSGQGTLLVTAPSGATVAFRVEVSPMDRGSATKTASTARDSSARVGLPGLVFTDFANRALRDACAQRNVGFADETGWLSLRNDSAPALLLSAQGADRALPIARETAINRLDGPGASKVVRALWAINRWPQGVRELAAEAGVSPGTVTKVLPALAVHGAVDRDDSGRVTRVSRRLLLDRWTQDYRFSTSNRIVRWYLAPRGLAGADQRVHSLPAGVMIRSTGPLAARMILPGELLSVTPLTLLAYYVDDPDFVAEFCGLVPTDRPSEANVVLAQPRDVNDADLLIPFGGASASILSVPPIQVLADLMSMGGRYPDLAQQMFDSRFSEESGVASA